MNIKGIERTLSFETNYNINRLRIRDLIGESELGIVEGIMPIIAKKAEGTSKFYATRAISEDLLKPSNDLLLVYFNNSLNTIGLGKVEKEKINPEAIKTAAENAIEQSKSMTGKFLAQMYGFDNSLV